MNGSAMFGMYATFLAGCSGDDSEGAEEADADTDTDSDTDSDADSDSDSDTDTIDVGTYSPAPVAILPLGDSITEYNYRYNLWTKLVDSGYSFDLVGSMTDEPLLDGAVHTWPEYGGLTLDSDHEGHSGWTSAHILNPPAWDSGRGSLSDWLADYTPDVVLIHLGTNDAFYERDNAAVMGSLSAIIELLRKDNPNVQVHLAKIIPLLFPYKGGGTYDDIVQGYNLAIEELASRLGTQSSPVILVDQYTDFDGKVDTYDLVHPSASGDEKMAAKWMASIEANTAPIGIPDAYVSTESPLVVDSAAGVLANDRSLVGSLRAYLLQSPTHGSLTIYSDGSFEYEGDGTPDQFKYRADDGTDSSRSVTVSVCAGKGC